MLNSKNNNRYRHLENLYADFQAALPIHRSTNNATQALTTFNGNKSQPIHRWFTFKEGFSAALFPWLINKLDIPQNGNFSILDPFCGVATSLLSAQLGNIPSLNNLIGIEINPFIAWVAETKLNWRLYDIQQIKSTIPDLIRQIKSPGKIESEIPSLSTINNPTYFERGRLKDLIRTRDIIRANIPEPEQDFFLLGWSSIIEAASNLRKDGRALRLVSHKTQKPIHQLLENQLESMLKDLQVASKYLPTTPAKILKHADGRSLENLEQQSFQYDLIIYSPPYPNNIDYSEVYKLELWLNEFITNQQEFRQLRLSTMRSHPSVKFPETNYFESIDSRSWSVKLIEALLRSLPHDKSLEWRSRLIRGYAEDMLISLRKQYQVVKDDGYVVCIVGNSVHGNSSYKFCIAADMIIAAIAQEVGFHVQELLIAREFNRRNFTSPFNRESILIFRK